MTHSMGLKPMGFEQRPVDAGLPKIWKGGVQSSDSFMQIASPARTDREGESRAREAAGMLVASAFVIPILEELRDSSMAEPPFAPGDAERRFGPLLDAQVADRVVSAANFRLVDEIAARYSRVSAQPAWMNKGGIDARS